ncbi:IS21 family transposase [Fictibacillus sp. NRS-1165]|uniref:IS21 family transposase n=1 Tax=Fictibacillus sp. NRS-1165 TaxID=3144463 RepID=UPI003D1C3A11
MLAMPEIDYIRHEANRKGNAYREIARKLAYDPRTVKKYAEMEDFSPEIKPVQIRSAKVMDPVKSILDTWIQEDFKKKKKFRRTAKRMYEMLVEDYEFKGSDRSVRHYVSKQKNKLAEETEQAALPLEAKPGTAQVDFGEAPFLHNGQQVVLPFLVMSFPYSNAFLFQVFPAQNKECFTEGMKRMFHYIGGVPKAIRFDNLSAAVKKIFPHGERELTESFQNFVLHYGFTPEFCNPASGNEKGHVEAMVKYTRNNFLIPELSLQNLEDLNQTFWVKAEKDRNRNHYQKEELIAKLYMADQEQFLQLPAKEFDCVRYEEVKADKYGYVRIENKIYSSSPRFAKQKVLAKISYNQVALLTDDFNLIVSHERLYGEQKQSVKWQPYLSLMAKRPMAIKYTGFYEQLPKEWQTYLEQCTVHEKQQALQLLSVFLKEHDFQTPTEALRLASERGHPSVDSIKQIFYQLLNGRGQRKEIDVQKSLPDVPSAVRGLSHYDHLMETGGDAG